MSPITMFMTQWCPHCKRALSWMEELKREDPRYANLEIKIVDEERESEIAEKHDYYYVPTYYVNEVKVHEGAASKEIIREVFEKAFA